MFFVLALGGLAVLIKALKQRRRVDGAAIVSAAVVQLLSSLKS